MGDWIDFAEIRARVSLEDVLLDMYQLGERFKRSGRKLVGSCPVHGGDNPRAFQADLEKNVWYCHTGCRRGGNAIDLVSAIDKLPVRDAALKLHARYCGGSSATTPPPGRSPPSSPSSPSGSAPSAPAVQEDKEAAAPEENPSNPPLTLKLNLSHDHPHILKERALSLETATRFGVGYCARGLMRGMIAIPVRDEDGDLVAYAGRRLKFADIEAHGKYRFPKNFRKELVLYNLDRAKAHAQERGLVVVEGFFSVLTLFEAGIENVVAAMGCSLSEAQCSLLAATSSSVTLLFDGDASGRAGAEEARARLDGRVATRLVRLPDGLDPTTVPHKTLRWALNGVHGLDLSDIAFSFRSPPKPKESSPLPEGGSH